MLYIKFYSKLTRLVLVGILSISTSLSHATESKQIASMGKSLPNIKICQYSFNSEVYTAQQQWIDEYDKIKNMDFFYLQTPQITLLQKINENSVEDVQIPIEVYVNVNYTVWGVKLLKSTGNLTLDQKIQRSYKDIRVETKKGFWWGPTLKFKDKIHLQLLRCQTLS